MVNFCVGKPIVTWQGSALEKMGTSEEFAEEIYSQHCPMLNHLAGMLDQIATVERVMTRLHEAVFSATQSSHGAMLSK